MEVVRTMFDEKRLLKAVQTAEKGGLAMTFSGESVYIRATSWMAVTTWERIKEDYRALLGHIVEVLGRIPENESLKITKGKGGYDVQPELPEVAAGEIAFYAETDREWPVKHTGLYWSGALLQDRTGRIWRCVGRGPHLAGEPALTDGCKAVTRDLDIDEAVYEIAYRAREDSPERERELWKHLESVMWTDWPDARTEDEIEGQEAMDL